MNHRVRNNLSQPIINNDKGKNGKPLFELWQEGKLTGKPGETRGYHAHLDYLAANRIRNDH